MKSFARLSLLLTLASATVWFGCGDAQPAVLPKIGFHDFVDGDTVFQKVGPFTFVDQDSQLVSNATFEDKIYVVDFFFISCPTICPKVTKQMLRIHDAYLDDPRVQLLAHTVDPVRDDVPALKTYAEALGVDADKWKFVTGDKDEIYEIADDYFSIATENPEAPGGFDHSGRIILVDWNGVVRSFCNGTEPEEVDDFLDDIDLLLSEYTRRS